MLIVTNFERFPPSWTASDGTPGRSVQARGLAQFLSHGREPDAVYLVNCNTSLVLALARKQLSPFAARRPIVAVDVIVRRPRGIAARLAVAAKKLLFGRVDLFVHYFRDTSLAHALFGIGGERAVFVPFKSNIWDRRSAGPEPDGDYALCFGRSLRDFDTFFAAMERTGLPGAIADPQAAGAHQHGSRFTRPLDQLPANVRTLPDDGTNEAQARLLAGARIVVVPVVKGSLVASGISTILNAMALGKCVVATEGPGVTDVFDGELISVRAEDPSALAAAIDRVWHDDALRTRTARLGWEYAQRCGGEQALFQRLIDTVVARRPPRHP